MSDLHQFLATMMAEKKLTRSSLSAYETDLQNFYHFINPQPIEHVTVQHIQGYLLTQTHLASSTIVRRLSSLRQFYTFLVTSGKIQENPFLHLQMTPRTTQSSLAVNAEDVHRLLEGAKVWRGPNGRRLSLLLQILSISDISVNELVALPLTVVWKESSVLDALRDYMTVRGYFLRHNQESEWLFPSASQKGHLTRQRFGQLLKELVSRVDLDPAHCSLYTIRRGLYNVMELERNLPYD